MAEGLGEAILVLRTDDSKLAAGLARAEGRAERAADKFDAAGQRMQTLGANLSLGLTVPLMAFGTSAFKAASDAVELESAFNVTFGKMAGAVRKWAEETGNAMGRSTEEMMGMAASYQDILKKQMDPAAAAALSGQLTVLTQDLASFKNLSNEEAKQKIFSGLIGEAEPLRAVGVLLSENAVKAKAAAMGLGGVKGALTEGEKVQARAALIMEQLADAQGDVMRTSDSTANQLKRSTAAWEEMQVEVGTKLLPVLTPLIVKLGDLLNWFTSLPDGVQTFVIAVAGIGTVAGPALMGIGALASGIGSLLPLLAKLGPVIGIVSKALLGLLANPVVLGAAAVIFGIYLAWKYWDEIKAIVAAGAAAVSAWWNENVKPILDALGAKLDEVIGWFRALPGKIGEALANAYTAVRTWLQERIGGVFAWIGERVNGVVSAFTSLGARASESARRLYQDVKYWLQEKLGAVLNAVKAPIEAVGNFFNNLYVRVVGNSDVPDLVDEVGQQFGRLDGVMVRPAQAATGAVGQGFADMARSAIGSIEGIVGAIRNGDFLGAIGQAAGLLGQIGQLIGGLGGGKLGGTLQAIGQAVGSIFGGGGYAGGFATGGLIPSGSFGIVGERGPEPVIGTSRGAMVLPNSTLRGAAAAPSVIELRVRRGEMFEAEVERISGGVSVRVVQEAAPAIRDAAVGETARQLGRPRI